jgi:hypothetical protein
MSGNEDYNLEFEPIVGQMRCCNTFGCERLFSCSAIKSEGFGESKPSIANDSPENRQFNRRVEFSLVSIKATNRIRLPNRRQELEKLKSELARCLI